MIVSLRSLPLLAMTCHVSAQRKPNPGAQNVSSLEGTSHKWPRDSFPACIPSWKCLKSSKSCGSPSTSTSYVNSEHSISINLSAMWQTLANTSLRRRNIQLYQPISSALKCDKPSPGYRRQLNGRYDALWHGNLLFSGLHLYHTDPTPPDQCEDQTPAAGHHATDLSASLKQSLPPIL